MLLIKSEKFVIFRDNTTIYVPQYADNFECLFDNNIIKIVANNFDVEINVEDEDNEFIYYFSDLKCADFMTNLDGEIFHIIGRAYSPDQMYKTMRVNKKEIVYINPSDTYFAIISNDEEYYQIGPNIRPCYKTEETFEAKIGRPIYCRADYTFAINPVDNTKIMIQFVHRTDICYAKSNTISYRSKPQNFDVVMGDDGDVLITGATKYYNTMEKFLGAKICTSDQITKYTDYWLVGKLKVYITTKTNKDTELAQIYNDNKSHVLGISTGKCTMEWFRVEVKNE